jgi:NAD-dependent deacetylase
MSTESGVPDFRSKNGLWHGKDPQLLASTEAMKYNKSEFVDFYRMRIQALQTVQPHQGYDILTTWANHLQLKTIITQNTDGLHEQAGNRNVIPLHGTIRQLHCNACGAVYSTDRYFSSDLFCNCGGFIRPSVVLFGEMLDSQILAAAKKEAQQADLFIVLGSSLVVSPANSFPITAKEHVAKLVIINLDSTPLDSIADAVINNRKIGDILQSISDELLLK